uniref:Uncharacterized protein n=1 Tax=Podoviridae sp. ct8Lf7 TaxID=2827723 RepID=A0A8S5S0X6_9CAUD|nr:MAG TPA: hypothetical protein [Podoviridae sp. ct8Lf7]
MFTSPISRIRNFRIYLYTFSHMLSMRSIRLQLINLITYQLVKLGISLQNLSMRRLVTGERNYTE